MTTDGRGEGGEEEKEREREREKKLNRIFFGSLSLSRGGGRRVVLSLLFLPSRLTKISLCILFDRENRVCGGFGGHNDVLYVLLTYDTRTDVVETSFPQTNRPFIHFLGLVFRGYVRTYVRTIVRKSKENKTRREEHGHVIYSKESGGKTRETRR